MRKARTPQEILHAAESLNVWRRAGERAPHKPLLLLLALSRLQRRESRWLSYTEIDDRLGRALKQFGPPHKTSPLYPFWHLQSDGLWQVTADAPIRPRADSTNPPKTELLQKHAQGGFPEAVYSLLKANPHLVDSLIRTVLAGHFPDSIHEDILNYMGLSLLADAGAARAVGPRSPRFAEEVIRAYGRCCAVCGYDVKIGSSDLGLEAAHIKWHQAGGPDEVPNGLALCTIHHKALDRGAIGVGAELEILVSCDINGSGVARWFEPFRGRRLAMPGRSEWALKPEYIEWHHREVFRPPAMESVLATS